MPISRENMKLYPGGSIFSREWRAIVERIGKRSGWKCEQCAAPHKTVICRGDRQARPSYMLPDGDVHDAETGEKIGRARGSEYPGRYVIVILTVAHLDQDVTNNADDNLRHWCQLHHNRHDAPHRRANAARTRRAHTGDLFGRVG